MISEDYIVGLTDGEGCFYVNIVSARTKPSWNPRIEMHFYIKLREDNKRLLEKVRQKLGCGHVYFQKENRPNHSQMYRYEVSSLKELFDIIVPFFNQHPLQGTKQKTFEIFCEIASLVKSKAHRTGEGLEKIKLLKLQLNR